MDGKTPLWERALVAVERGQLPVEEVLKAALREGDFGAWLEGSLARAEKREPQLVQFRREKSYGAAVLDAALAQAKEKLGDIEGVVHVSWGLKYTGRRVQGNRALVVWVDRKVGEDQLAEGQRVPRRFTAVVRNRRYTFVVDVQIRKTLALQSATQVRPGDRARVFCGNSMATLSALLEKDAAGQGRALMSGHAVPGGARSVTAQIGNDPRIDLGVVEKRLVNATVDAALVTGVKEDDYMALGLGWTTVRDLGPADGYPGLTLHLVEGTHTAFVTAYDAPAFVGDEAMTGLIRLDDQVTVGGDSGAPCLDYMDRLVGFVVGVHDDPNDHEVRNHTYIIPARRVIDALVN